MNSTKATATATTNKGGDSKAVPISTGAWDYNRSWTENTYDFSKSVHRVAEQLSCGPGHSPRSYLLLHKWDSMAQIEFPTPLYQYPGATLVIQA